MTQIVKINTRDRIDKKLSLNNMSPVPISFIIWYNDIIQ